GHCDGIAVTCAASKPVLISRHDVVAPSDADVTVFAYFASTPRFSRGGGCFHAALRFASSCSLRATDNSFLSASIVTTSPFFKRAIGPPTCDSGQTWPTHMPRVP